jgi:hypothetical protein
VPPIYATWFSKKYSMKLRLLSRTWPDISKLEHTVYKKVQMAESYQNKKKTWKKQKKQKNNFRESWLGPPLPKSLEILCFFVFPRFLPSVGYFKETGMNHRKSCQSAFGSAVKHLKISSKTMGKLQSQGPSF